MLFAWDVSGAHFNPSVTIAMLLNTKDPKGNSSMALLMIVAQFCGATLGWLLGYMAVLSKDLMSDAALERDKDHDANVSDKWLGILAPKLPLSGVDTGTRDSDNDLNFSKDWQTFWAMTITSIIVGTAFCTLKNDDSVLGKDVVLKILAFTFVLQGVQSCNDLFGTFGYNPALACMWVAYEVTQYESPNKSYDSEQLNHYVWAYIIGPLLGGAAAGILALIHQKCAGDKNRNTSRGDVKEIIFD